MLKALRFPAIVENVMMRTQVEASAAQAGLGRSLAAMVIIPLCFDAASANRLLFNYLLLYYKIRQSRCPAIVVFLAMVLCVAHQVHLCSKSAMAVLGGASKTFTSGLIACAHTFANPAYFVRIFIGLSASIQSSHFWSAAEAAPHGHHLATTAERAAKVALLEYVLRWVVGRRKLAQEEVDAIRCIVDYFNASLSSWSNSRDIVHIHNEGCFFTAELNGESTTFLVL